MELFERLRTALDGRYRLERELGRGGMAVVFLARDVKLGRRVALKVLRPELAASLGPQRFLREIQIEANLQHPNILPLHDAGEADGLLYYVMPYLEGASLRDRLESEGQLPIDDIISISSDVADALSYAHSQGVLHRDIKPDNILLSEGHAFLSDFGVARAISAAGGDRLTSSGIAVGTPEYMSPEQGMADPNIDARSDLYSLGCVLHEMLAGQPPFTGPTGQAIIARHISERPPSIRIVRPTVTNNVERVVNTALAKVPADRYRTALKLAEALRVAVTTPQHERLPRAVRAVAAIVLLAAAGLAVAIVVRQGQSANSRSPPMVLVLPFANLGQPEDAQFARGITDEITSRIAEFAELAVISSASAAQYDPVSTTVESFARELGADHLVVGTIRTDRSPDGSGKVLVTPHLVRVSDNVEIWTDRFEAPLMPGEIFHVQAVIAERVASALDVTLLSDRRHDVIHRPTDNLQAYDSYLRGNLYSSQLLVEAATKQAVEMYKEAVALDPGFALAHAKLAQAQSMYYYFFDPRPENLHAAKQAVDHAFELNPELPEARVALGYYHYWGHLDYAVALEQFELARQELPNSSELLWVIGSVQRRQGRWEAALEKFLRAFRLDPRSQMFAFEAAGTLQGLRRYEEAQEYYDRARALAPDWVPAYLSTAQLHLVWTGDVDQMQGIISEAARHLGMGNGILPVFINDISYRPMLALLAQNEQDSLANFSLTLAAVDSGSYYLAKAEYHHRDTNLPRAVAYFDSARSVWEDRVRLRSSDPAAHIELGTAYAGLGRRDDALREALIAHSQRPLQRDALRGMFWYVQLARLYAMIGEEERAVNMISDLLKIPSLVTEAGLRVDPTFDALRRNKRFQELVRGARVATGR